MGSIEFNFSMVASIASKITFRLRNSERGPACVNPNYLDCSFTGPAIKSEVTLSANPLPMLIMTSEQRYC